MRGSDQTQERVRMKGSDQTLQVSMTRWPEGISGVQLRVKTEEWKEHKHTERE